MISYDIDWSKNMKIIKQSWDFEGDTPDGNKMLKKIEKCARTCWKSEDKQTDESAPTFVKGVMNKNHLSVIEHESVSVRIVTDRGVLAEITRHRLFSFSVESTRFANYSKDKFGNEITCILPVWLYEEKQDSESFLIWEKAMKDSEEYYMKLLKKGWRPQEARQVLNNSLKTEIVMTGNLRNWRHFFELRTGPAAHPQVRELAKDMLKDFKEKIPVFFDDL